MFGKKFVGRLFGNGNGRKFLFGKKQTQGCKGNRQGTKEESSYNEERPTVVCVFVLDVVILHLTKEEYPADLYYVLPAMPNWSDVEKMK